MFCICGLCCMSVLCFMCTLCCTCACSVVYVWCSFVCVCCVCVLFCICVLCVCVRVWVLNICGCCVWYLLCVCGVYVCLPSVWHAGAKRAACGPRASLQLLQWRASLRGAPGCVSHRQRVSEVEAGRSASLNRRPQPSPVSSVALSTKAPCVCVCSNVQTSPRQPWQGRRLNKAVWGSLKVFTKPPLWRECGWRLVSAASPGGVWLDPGAGLGCTPVVHWVISRHRLNQPSPYTLREISCTATWSTSSCINVCKPFNKPAFNITPCASCSMDFVTDTIHIL